MKRIIGTLGMVFLILMSPGVLINAWADLPPPGISAELMEELKFSYENYVKMYPFATPQMIRYELLVQLAKMKEVGMITMEEVRAVQAFGLQNIIAQGFPGASTLMESIMSYRITPEDQQRLKELLAQTNPTYLQRIMLLASAASTYVVNGAEALAAIPGVVPAAAAVVSGGAFLATGMLHKKSLDELNATSQQLYVQCMMSAPCAAAQLAGDAASVLIFNLGGTISKYQQGTYTDLGAGSNPDRRFAWVDPNVIPGYTLYRFPNNTVILMSTDGQTLLGTTTDGGTYVATQVPGQPGVYAITYSNGARATLNNLGFVMGTQPKGDPGTGGGGPNGAIAFESPPSIYTVSYQNLPSGTVTACWWNGSKWDCGY